MSNLLLNNASKNLQIAIQCLDDVSLKSMEKAELLAKRLGLELLSSSNLKHNNIKHLDFLLCFKNDTLSLKDTETETEISVDFTRVNKSRLNKKIQLAKAVGFKSGYVPSIIDATAGMGRDAYTLAALGSSVTLIEQSQIVASLLADGMERQKIEELESIEAMSLLEGNAVELIPSLEEHDVIYLDPMFADRAKQALPKKEMQMFRKLLGHDDNVDALLEVALEHAKKRVVVKRHRTAKPLLDKKPHAQLMGKQTRFDIYLT